MDNENIVISIDRKFIAGHSIASAEPTNASSKHKEYFEQAKLQN